jgi:hypothetical protein
VSSQTDSGDTLNVKKPLFDDNLAYTEAQKIQEAAVRDATTYASFAQSQETYVARAEETGLTSYALAMADWFGSPRVLEIDVDNWTGRTGQTIRVKARDNVKVERVWLVIRDAWENVLEMGEAVQSEAGSPWWNYTTTAVVPMTPFPLLEAIAWDLPGNSDSFFVN